MPQDKRFIKTRFPGVYYREVIDGGRIADRAYYVNIADGKGGRKWKSMGLHSEGVRPENCAAARSRVILPSAAGGIAVAAAPSCTIAEAVDLYCASARKSIDNAILQGEFYGHCVSFHNIPIDNFSAAQAEEFKNRLFRDGLSAQTVRHILYFVRRCVERAISLGKAKKNPFLVIRGGIFRMPRVSNRREKFLTKDEAAELLARLKMKSLPLYQMAALSLYTGLRAVEIFNLRREDIDAASGCIHIDAKTKRREVVRAPAKIIAMLLAIPVHPSGLVFPNQKGKRRTAISKTFCAVVTEMGIQKDRHSHWRVNFHTLRHTYASWLAQSGQVTLHELQALMRHRSLTMTLRYAHLIPSAVQDKALAILDKNLINLENG